MHEVVDRAEHGGVGGGRDGRGGDGAGDEAHVVPAVLGDAVGGDLEHLFGGIDPDDGAGGADLVLQQRQAQSGAAAHVQHGVAAADGKLLDE